MGFVSIFDVGGDESVDKEIGVILDASNLGFGGAEFACLQSLGRSSAFFFF